MTISPLALAFIMLSIICSCVAVFAFGHPYRFLAYAVVMSIFGLILACVDGNKKVIVRKYD